MDRKLRVGISSSYPGVKTGFSHNMLCLMPYLYNTQKYELFFLAHGFSPGNLDFARFPWVTDGAIKNFDQGRWNSGDEGYKRLVSYGNTSTEEFVVKNKLDVFILCEDQWAGDPSFFFDKPFFNHINKNFLMSTTVDSLPILPLIKEWSQKVPNYWVWASFAEKAMKEEDPVKYGHVKTVPGTLDVNNFTILSEKDRVQWREQWGIKPEETIIMYLGRNQLRKLYWSHLEALARLRKLHPEYKVRLLFHCSWTEPMGWPLDRIREELGLKKEDVLTTYYCQQCSHWKIQQYEGENLECKLCGHKTGLITAGVGSPITEEELSAIYNLADGACSVFTSGGLEYFNVESLLCGLPLASSPYSSGADFTCNDFVTTIDGTFTREAQTGFKKFVPDIRSITNFYKKIHDMKPEKRREIGLRGREWAVKTFSAETIGKKIEDFIDSCKKIDWDAYELKIKETQKPKNPDALTPRGADDTAWIKLLYKNILNMEINDQDSGLIHWQAMLKQGMSKDDIEKYFKSVALDKNKEIGKFDFESLFDKTDKKRLLMVMPCSFGDILWASALLKDAHDTYGKDYDIYFACEPKYQELLEGNPYIHKIINFYPEFDSLLFLEGAGSHKGLVDIAFLLYWQTQRAILYTHNAQDKISYNTRKFPPQEIKGYL